jgi:hypothetical protein
LVSAAIFTTVIYALLFQLHDDLITSCESRNKTRIELTERAKAFDLILDQLAVHVINDAAEFARLHPNDHSDHRAEAREAVRDLREARSNISVIPPVDCEAEYSKPWPF